MASDTIDTIVIKSDGLTEYIARVCELKPCHIKNILNLTGI